MRIVVAPDSYKGSVVVSAICGQVDLAGATARLRERIDSTLA